MKRHFAGLVAAAALAVGSMSAHVPTDPLPSWNEGPTKKSITDFVARVTKADGSDFVPQGQRIATFDNDGTLWSEQPLYFQFLFAIDRVRALAAYHPQWKDEEPFASLTKGDTSAALASGEDAIEEVLAATHAGMTTDEFESTVRGWLATARHPQTKQPLTRMVYTPMLELMAYLRANGFKTFIVSGGGVEFMRAFAEPVYGVPPEQVVGSSATQQFKVRNDRPVLVKLPNVDFIDDGPGKPVGIQRFIGRRPIAAFGNSDGDLQMLEWTCMHRQPSLCLYVHHTDAMREWAYDRASSVGKLDKGLDEARAQGWTLVDMKADWNRVFAFEPRHIK